MKYIRSEFQKTKKSIHNKKIKYARNDIISKIIRGVKRCNDGVNRFDKENQRVNFKILLGFK